MENITEKDLRLKEQRVSYWEIYNSIPTRYDLETSEEMGVEI